MPPSRRAAMVRGLTDLPARPPSPKDVQMHLALSLALQLAAAPAAAGADPAPLRFDQVLATRPGGQLDLSPRVRSLAGQRVRMVGFMARMEVAAGGAFYLVPRPLTTDESGAGSADLPLEAVRVVVRSARGQPLAYIPRALEVVGVLEVGQRIEPDGLPSTLRIVLDSLPRGQKGAP
jgi:hypothetical protein